MKAVLYSQASRSEKSLKGRGRKAWRSQNMTDPGVEADRNTRLHRVTMFQWAFILYSIAHLYLTTRRAGGFPKDASTVCMDPISGRDSKLRAADRLCDFTQMFAARGIKRLPQYLKIATFFDISILPGKRIWRHMTAGSIINEKQRLAESTNSVLVDVDNVLGRENEQE
jgi:hypothetical protein